MPVVFEVDDFVPQGISHVDAIGCSADFAMPSGKVTYGRIASVDLYVADGRVRRNQLGECRKAKITEVHDKVFNSIGIDILSQLLGRRQPAIDPTHRVSAGVREIEIYETSQDLCARAPRKALTRPIGNSDAPLICMLIDKAI